jgi:S-DNA-T family DNA segregation ATPase FtsK/SpoIIIE
MQRRELEAKADAIEMVTNEHHAPCRVTGGHVTPRWVQFLVEPNRGVRPVRIESLSREIAAALGAPSARVTSQGNAIRIEVPRSDPQPLKLLPLCARIPPSRIPFGTAVLGLADDGAPLLIRLPSPEVAHLLVTGTTGSGKTALMQTIIMSLALLNHHRAMKFVLIDSKGDPHNCSFAALTGLPHLLQPTAINPDLIERTLDAMIELAEKRCQSHATDPRVVVVIDDFDRLHSKSQDKVAALLKGGFEAGIHVIGATQKSSSSISGLLAGFPVRIVGRVVSAEDARVAAGVGGTGAEKLTGRGDFVAVYGPGLIRFQAANTSTSEIKANVQQLAQGIRGDEIIQSGRPSAAATLSRPRNSVLDSAVFALPGIER